MSYSFDVKEKALILRKEGYSIKEIAHLLGIAQSTSSLWLKRVILDLNAQNRLKERRILGQYKAIETVRLKRETTIAKNNEKAARALSQIRFDTNIYKLLCSIFFWTEGGKYTDNYVYFMNSDPEMIKVFMNLLRTSFSIDETKLRALVHLHSYHNEIEIKQYWSKITKIPLTQFSKSYQKTNTKKRVREGYQGCIRIRYYDHKIALELRSFYNILSKII